jgi:D-3-phosphoglycerate dehydrogenase
MGIVGVGQIGVEVIVRARAFGLKIIAWSRSLTAEAAEELGVVRAGSLEELIPRCDIVSVHLALKPETRGIISKALIATMRPGAILLNTARAEVVDEEALVEAVTEGRIRVGTDVFAGEPEDKAGKIQSALAGLPGVTGTHHIGASTSQAQEAVADEVVRIVDRYKRYGEVPNWVNRQRTTAATWQLVVRHFDKPGVLANVLGELKSAGINVQEVENVVFEGAHTACCTLRLDARPAPSTVDAIASRRDEVISAVLNPL